MRPPEDYVALRGQFARALASPAPRRPAGAPVLVLAGALDRVCPADAAAGLAAASEGAELEVLPRCGHVPFVCADDGGATARIREFLLPRVAA